MGTLNERVKMFLFARWVSTVYADDHLDDDMNHQSSPNFNPTEGMSVLNRESGLWWKEQLDHFNTIVYPNYIENGSVKSAKEFLSKKKPKKIWLY